ncbi:hypothetical protein V8G54_027190 [Vigna mungo]|uniref:Uncharacterized protein n=1 Tax=Vigna mungo TaxID=3915 RepID=A0AAQ3N1U6_VIGMU
MQLRNEQSEVKLTTASKKNDARFCQYVGATWTDPAGGAIAGTSPLRSKLEDHRTVKGEGKRAVKIQEKRAIRPVQASESEKATSEKISATNETLFEEKVYELAYACEDLERKSNFKDMESEMLKEKVCKLEGENEKLRLQLTVYVPTVSVLNDCITFLEMITLGHCQHPISLKSLPIRRLQVFGENLGLRRMLQKKQWTALANYGKKNAGNRGNLQQSDFPQKLGTDLLIILPSRDPHHTQSIGPWVPWFLPLTIHQRGMTTEKTGGFGRFAMDPLGQSQGSLFCQWAFTRGVTSEPLPSTKFFQPSEPKGRVLKLLRVLKLQRFEAAELPSIGNHLSPVPNGTNKSNPLKLLIPPFPDTNQALSKEENSSLKTKCNVRIEGVRVVIVVAVATGVCDDFRRRGGGSVVVRRRFVVSVTAVRDNGDSRWWTLKGRGTTLPRSRVGGNFGGLVAGDTLDEEGALSRRLVRQVDDGARMVAEDGKSLLSLEGCGVAGDARVGRATRWQIWSEVKMTRPSAFECFRFLNPQMVKWEEAGRTPRVFLNEKALGQYF